MISVRPAAEPSESLTIAESSTVGMVCANLAAVIETKASNASSPCLRSPAIALRVIFSSESAAEIASFSFFSSSSDRDVSSTTAAR